MGDGWGNTKLYIMCGIVDCKDCGRGANGQGDTLSCSSCEGGCRARTVLGVALMFFVACILIIVGEVMRYVWAPCTFGVVSKCGKVVVRGGECCCFVCVPALPNTFCLWCVVFRRTFVWSGPGVETWLCFGGGALREESGS